MNDEEYFRHLSRTYHLDKQFTSNNDNGRPHIVTNKLQDKKKLALDRKQYI